MGRAVAAVTLRVAQEAGGADIRLILASRVPAIARGRPLVGFGASCLRGRGRAPAPACAFGARLLCFLGRLLRRPRDWTDCRLFVLTTRLVQPHHEGVEFGLGLGVHCRQAALGNRL